MSAVGRELLAGIICALREEPAFARDLRDLLGTASLEAKVDSAEVFMRARDYAAHVSVSERTVWNLIARGLPTIGKGRSRRIDVERADLWLRNERAAVDDSVEQSARESARRAARAVR
jgi:hypothetical protein